MMYVSLDTFYDSDGDALTLSAQKADVSELAEWLSLISNKWMFYGHPSMDDIGTHFVTLSASDNREGEVSDTFSIEVVPMSTSSDGDGCEPCEECEECEECEQGTSKSSNGSNNNGNNSNSSVSCLWKWQWGLWCALLLGIAVGATCGYRYGVNGFEGGGRGGRGGGGESAQNSNKRSDDNDDGVALDADTMAQMMPDSVELANVDLQKGENAGMQDVE